MAVFRPAVMASRRCRVLALPAADMPPLALPSLRRRRERRPRGSAVTRLRRFRRATPLCNRSCRARAIANAIAHAVANAVARKVSAAGTH